MVHATVYRTFSRGLRQASGAVLGVLLAWVVGHLLGLTTLGVSALLATGLLVGAMRWFRAETTAVAATGLSLTTASETGSKFTLSLLLAVNSVVAAAKYAARAIDVIDDGVGELLRDIAHDLREPCDDKQVAGWVDRTRELDP